MKTCTHCKKEKPTDAFPRCSRLKDGLASWCRDCYSVQYQNNRERELKRNSKNELQRKYGLSPEKAQELRKNGCCVCGARGKRAPHIDHCHTTGQIRGALCYQCNLVLGYVKDDPSRLRALADYLERFAEQVRTA